MESPTTAPLEDLLDAIRRHDDYAVASALSDDPSLAFGVSARGEAPLMTATYHRARKIIARLAHRRGLTIFEAAAMGETTRVRVLLARDRRFATATGPDGSSALAVAAHFGHMEIAQVLLGLGADAHAASLNEAAETPLHRALAGGQPAIAKLLIDRGASVTARRADGITPLHLAAEQGDMAMVERLLDAGAMPESTEDGRTPSDLARESGHADMALLLA